MSDINIIRITPEIEQLNDKEYMIVLSLFIDGVKHYDYAVDIYNIASMLKPAHQWGHSFWTCGCGERGCAGIEDMELQNSHTESKLQFNLFHPVSYREAAVDNDNWSDKVYDRWLEIRTTQNVVIDKKQLHTELTRLADELEKLVAHCLATREDRFIGFNDGSLTLAMLDEEITEETMVEYYYLVEDLRKVLAQHPQS
jgi:hypothetical protein